MKKEKRREKVLISLIDEFIENNEPVSSKLLNNKYITDVSSATLRIDLHKLEEKNFVYQPYTSGGRIPTIKGYREYVKLNKEFYLNKKYAKADILRNILVNNYKDTDLTLHFIKQLLAKETDQLSFVAEPEIAYGYLEKLNVFKISKDKLLFVVSLDSGLDKTVIIKCDYAINEKQINVLVRYINEELTGLRIYDIRHKYLEKINEDSTNQNKLITNFLRELSNVLSQISHYYINFDAGLEFINRPEFDKKEKIFKFLALTQQQDFVVKLLQDNYNDEHDYNVLMGEDLIETRWNDFAIIYAKYEIFGIPGFLGVISPIRMNYRKNISLVRNIAKIITNTTKKGMMVPSYEK